MDWLISFDYHNYLLDEDDVRLLQQHNFPGKAHKTIITEEETVRKEYTITAVLRYAKDGTPYACLETVPELSPDWEAWCKEGENHRKEERGDRVVFFRDITVFFWTISFDTVEDLTQFLIEHQPFVEKIKDEELFGQEEQLALHVCVFEDLRTQKEIEELLI